MVCLLSQKNDAKLISEALKVLGKDNLALIIHGSSFPSVDGQDTGFGTFKAVKKAARTGINPATKAQIKIPAKVAPAFKAGKALKDAVNK